MRFVRVFSAPKTETNPSCRPPWPWLATGWHLPPKPPPVWRASRAILVSRPKGTAYLVVVKEPGTKQATECREKNAWISAINAK